LHLGYLDGLRAVAALFVVCHHALFQSGIDLAALPPWQGDALAVLVYGHNAVNLFIVLSGFCLMLPVARGDGTLRNGVAAFLKRRSWRILPPYYGAILLSIALIWLCIGSKTGTNWDGCIPVTAKALYSHIFLIQDAVGQDHTINYVFWSIAVEWRIYFLFPLLLWAWRRYGAIRTTVVAAIASQFLYLLLRKLIHADLNAHYIGLFAMGMLGASISFSREPAFCKMRTFPWTALLILSAITVVLLIKVNLFHGKPMPMYITDDFVGFASMALLVAVSINSHHPLNRLLSWKPVVFVGTFAYSIYLIHAPLLQIFWQLLPSLHSRPSILFIILLLAGTPLIIFSSYLFFLVFERPFLRAKFAPPRSLIAKTVVEPAP